MSSPSDLLEDYIKNYELGQMKKLKKQNLLCLKKVKDSKLKSASDVRSIQYFLNNHHHQQLEYKINNSNKNNNNQIELYNKKESTSVKIIK